MIRNIKYEGLKDLNYGDEIVLSDPMKQQEVPYVYMSKDSTGGFHFISGYGASFMIKEQATIDGFGVMLIDDQHPAWDSDLSDHGKKLGDMLDTIESLNDDEAGNMLHEVLEKSTELEIFGPDD